MVDPVVARLWGFRLFYAGLIAALLFFHLLPLQIESPRRATPDLILCLTYAWAIRRPACVPALLVAFVFLLSDMLLQRPPGLFAALAVLGCEFLRSRSPFMRDAPFPVEWAMVGIVILATLFANRVLLMLVLVTPPALWPSIMQFAMTVLAYPVVVGVSRLLFGVTRTRPQDPESRRAMP